MCNCLYVYSNMSFINWQQIQCSSLTDASKFLLCTCVCMQFDSSIVKEAKEIKLCQKWISTGILYYFIHYWTVLWKSSLQWAICFLHQSSLCWCTVIIHKQICVSWVGFSIKKKKFFNQELTLSSLSLM